MLSSWEKRYRAYGMAGYRGILQLDELLLELVPVRRVGHRAPGKYCQTCIIYVVPRMG